MTNDSQGPKNKSEAKARHNYRMRHDWNNLIDDLIEEGQRDGVFDNLPGKGAPLKLKRNPYARQLELAHELLKKNDLKPAWITARSELQTQIELLRQAVKKQWGAHERAYRLAQGEGHRGALVVSWDDVCLEWEKTIAALNKQIDGFNLKRPFDNMELFKLNLEQELERAGARRWLRPL